MSSTLKKTLSCLLMAAGGMYITSRVVNYIATKNNLLKADPENLYDWKGFKVYYRSIGSGDPVILLHALHPASSAEEWSAIVEDLSRDHTVYVLDLPGCGRSDKDRLHYTNFFYVELIKDFIRSNHIEGAAVVASNLSAAVAVMAAGYDKELFSKIILISPPAISRLMKTPDFFSTIGMFLLNLPILGNFIYTLMAARRVIDYYFTEHFFYNPFHDTEELVNTYYESAHLGNGRGNYLAGSMVGKLLNVDISHVLSKLTIPIKLIKGRESDDTAQALTEWRAVNGDIVTATIKHTKALPHLEEPEAVLEEIRSML